MVNSSIMFFWKCFRAGTTSSLSAKSGKIIARCLWIVLVVGCWWLWSVLSVCDWKMLSVVM